MINALDVLTVINHADRIQSAIRDCTQTVLTSWRPSALGKSDDDILRDKLVECGWKYSRQKGGRWVRPKVESFPVPATLHQLAQLIATTVVKDALAKG